ncbi:hypothetical protein ACFLSQ_08040 [Bacteroidota bacterium]
MKKKFINILIILILTTLFLHSQVPEFEGPVDLGIVDTSILNEASGIAASKINKNVLWTHNDEGSDPRIFAINSSAKILAIYYLDINDGRDWEDIATGPGPDEGSEYIYLGDIGDNLARFDKKYIYRFKEPFVDEKQNLITDTINIIDKISFKYPDKIYDAEAVMLDPITKDLYVVSKRLQNEKVFRLPYPQSTSKTITAEYIATLPFGFEGLDGTGVSAGDISSDGSEILIKNYSKMYFFKRSKSATIQDALKQNPAEVHYQIEPQGEAVCWHPESSGYYTLSETSRFNIPAHLYFYPRKVSGVKKKH